MMLDEIDKRILRELQQNGRLQNIELARRVGLSPSPCLRRVKVGLRLSMFARVWLTAQDAETIDHFTAAMRRLPEVVECYIMLGESDALLRVVVADLEDYRRFQATHLTRRNGIQNVKTDVPSETVKQTFALPL
jgi:Lrp/AsnC family transcriptional regulator, leucine-responsive regulatory protein